MKILLATDGSLSSQAAGNFLARLPWPSTRELTVLSVIDKRGLLPATEKRAQDHPDHAVQQVQQALHQDAQHLLAQEAERFTTIGWTPQTQLREGHAAHEIVSAAQEIGADVIAIGSRGMGSIKRFLLGSISEQVLTYAPCSVLITRQRHHREPNPADEETNAPLRLFLAYDDSPSAKAAVETIASLPLPDHTHILVTSVMTLLTYYRMDILQTMSASWQDAKQAAEEHLEQAAEILRQTTPNVTVQLRESDDTSQALLDAARDFDANLVVMGHKGKSGIERLLLGSAANRMVHHAPCSVWVIRQ